MNAKDRFVEFKSERSEPRDITAGCFVGRCEEYARLEQRLLRCNSTFGPVSDCSACRFIDCLPGARSGKNGSSNHWPTGWIFQGKFVPTSRPSHTAARMQKQQTSLVVFSTESKKKGSSSPPSFRRLFSLVDASLEKKLPQFVFDHLQIALDHFTGFSLAPAPVNTIVRPGRIALHLW